MKISILTIGDEICIGQIINTNAAWLAKTLTQTGAIVETHSVVRDDRTTILKEIDRLFTFSDLVILTGGLGPTHDDITKQVLCEYFNDELVINVPALENIKELFKRRGYILSQRNIDQALVPSKCTVLENKAGSAPAMLFNSNGKYLISSPGVPTEMKYITTNGIIPFVIEFQNKNPQETVIYKTIQTAGIPESMLAELLEPIDELLNGSSLAFLPSYYGVRLRIGVKGTSRDKILETINDIDIKINNKAGKYIIGYGEDGMLELLAEKLTQIHKTVSVAESCTGGLLGAKLTELPGSSSYFIGGVQAYSNDVKSGLLSVTEETLDTYGAVSKKTAIELAGNVRILFKSDYGISITGIAGPDGGTEEKPVGTVWIGISSGLRTYAKLLNFGNDRISNREKAVGAALSLLFREVNNNI